MPGFILGTSKLGEDRLGPIGIASSNLGGLIAQATATRTTFASAQGVLGELVANTNASITNYATANANLDGLTSQGNANVIHNVQGESVLGSLISSANADVENVVNANALLGAIDSNASVAVIHYSGAISQFGELISNANTRPETQIIAGAGGHPQFVQPNLPSKVKPIQESSVETQFGLMVTAQFGGLISDAKSKILFSITEDESELLLMI